MTEQQQRVRVAIVGSGSGTNARALCAHAQTASARYNVCLIVSTKADIGLVQVANDFDVTCVVLDSRETFAADLVSILRHECVDVLLLAGLMRHVPEHVIAELHGNVLNVHPSLLPRYGGVGMYGIHVHRAVVEARDRTTGATVHLVTNEYDEGQIIAQDSLEIDPNETAEHVQERVKHLEHTLYPAAVDKFCLNLRKGASGYGMRQKT